MHLRSIKKLALLLRLLVLSSPPPSHPDVTLCYGSLHSPFHFRLLVPEFSFDSHMSLPSHSHGVTQLLLLREDSVCLQTLPKPPPPNPNKAGGGEGRQVKGKENSFVSQPSCHCPLDEAQLLSGHSRPQRFSPIPSFQFDILYSQHKFPIWSNRPTQLP